MSTVVALGANTWGYRDGGGHLWEYLNWALGLDALGCQVVWLERVPAAAGRDEVRENVAALTRALAPYGLADAVALAPADDARAPLDVTDGAVPADELEVDLVLSLTYLPPPRLAGRPRTALLDLDPGLLQIWLDRGWLDVEGYDAYFTVGETVGRPDAAFPDGGFEWLYTPSCVALDRWPASNGVGAEAVFATVSNWSTYDEWMEESGGWYSNDKRAGFEPFLDLPRRTGQTLELALSLAPHEAQERASLTARGWRVVSATDVAATPWDYQGYIRRSRGEFSCAKPSCVRLRNAWISNRTLCFLASGRPAVVQDTGPSGILPNGEGLFRFRTLDEAASALDAAAADYDRQSRLARALAEERFDARKVLPAVLERALA